MGAAKELVGRACRRATGRRRGGPPPRGGRAGRAGARLIVCRVVSFPAVVRRMKKRPNSCSERREPSTSASTSLVVMSSRGLGRRASPSLVPYSISSSENGLENGSSRSSGSWQCALLDELLAHDLGVGVAEDLVAELDDQPPVLDGQAHDLGEDPHRDLRGDVLDPVELLPLERLREDAPGEGADPLLVGVDDARREALVDERAQPRVRRRVGVDHRLPRLDLLRRQVLERRAAGLGASRSPSPSTSGRCRRSG